MEQCRAVPSRAECVGAVKPMKCSVHYKIVSVLLYGPAPCSALPQLLPHKINVARPNRLIQSPATATATSRALNRHTAPTLRAANNVTKYKTGEKQKTGKKTRTTLFCAFC